MIQLHVAQVSALTHGHSAAVVAVLCEAFFSYPVMRHVLGSVPDYPTRLRTLIGFFVDARFLRQDLVLGVFDRNLTLAAAALVTLPGDKPAPAALAGRREATWQELGNAERARYDEYGMASHQFDILESHHHLNMIGVRQAYHGQGYARTLLDHLHRLVDLDPVSHGVTLSTETQRNVGLYERFGYTHLGHARISTALETWAFYRPKDQISTATRSGA